MTTGQAAHGPACRTHRATYRAATNRANRTAAPNPAQSGAAAKQAKIQSGNGRGGSLSLPVKRPGSFLSVLLRGNVPDRNVARALCRRFYLSALDRHLFNGRPHHCDRAVCEKVCRANHIVDGLIK